MENEKNMNVAKNKNNVNYSQQLLTGGDWLHPALN